jgi:hypothetical protein
MPRFSWGCSLLGLLLFLCTAAWAEPDHSSPEATLKSYLEACKAGDFAAADACYTASSRKFLAETPAFTEGRQPEMLLGTYDRLSPLTFTTEKVNGKRAILHPNDEKVPPFFMRIQNPKEGWRIDWHFMANYLRADQNGWSWVNPRALGIWKSRE